MLLLLFALAACSWNYEDYSNDRLSKQCPWKVRALNNKQTALQSFTPWYLCIADGGDCREFFEWALCLKPVRRLIWNCWKPCDISVPPKTAFSAILLRGRVYELRILLNPLVDYTKLWKSCWLLENRSSQCIVGLACKLVKFNKFAHATSKS